MKILRLTTLLDFGGIETKMANLSTYNDEENEWVFVALGKGGEAEKKIRANGKRIQVLGFDYKIPSIKTIWKFYKFLKKEKPHVLHTSGAEANFFGFFSGKLAGVPKIVVEEIGIPNQSPVAKKIFRFIFNNADCAVGESKVVVDHFVSTYQINPDKAKVVSNFGLFQYNLSKLNVQKEEHLFNILMISRLEKVKNIEGVINVVARLCDTTSKNIRLTIAGSGALEQELKKKVEQMNLQNHVHFLGFITDPYPHLCNADLYVLNSHSEGFSNSLVEAMYSKTPSLSTSVGAAPEIIEDGINGFLTPANDEEVLFDKLKAIIALPKEKLQEIGRAGQDKIMTNFSLENHVNALMKIYTHS
ncbi:glycosyltransferase [Candidatus Kaistella beijingensis]|uniref:glycosyltransferase n=1 Tax=Candidatus Kaistella beijingensis TaxID=2820270 RepID=UPI001CC636F2|nr:glycosyltransferase [Candidatus Kaistella beijingensis]UBB88542.1 glycosyltransferase [Candidatus Kaistella beijingensis]